MKTGKLQAAKMILRDAWGLRRVGGVGLAARWLSAVARNFKTCARSHHLNPADDACGPGPFPVRRGRARAKIYGPGSVSGIREIWVRDIYLRDDFLSIGPNARVIDLGANMGNFTVLALAHGPGVHVISVELSGGALALLRDNVSANQWLDRVTICERLIGGILPIHREALGDLIGTDEGASKPAMQMTEDEFIQTYNIDRIDFLKCDIEGSEFELFRPGSRLLRMADQIAIEIHGWGGNIEQFEAMLRDEGFELMQTHDFADGGVMDDRVVLGRRRGNRTGGHIAVTGENDGRSPATSGANSAA